MGCDVPEWALIMASGAPWLDLEPDDSNLDINAIDGYGRIMDYTWLEFR